MSLKKDIEQVFKESYLEHLCQFLKNDKEYLFMREKIYLAETEAQEFPTENNKKILKQNKLKIAEYLNISIYKMGFSEGINHSKPESKQSLIYRFYVIHLKKHVT